MPRLLFNMTISIHAPHARSDLPLEIMVSCLGYFNPRSSCEERRCRATFAFQYDDFNPRSSCEERQSTFSISVQIPFQSTLLMRGATRSYRTDRGLMIISIHAPHARSDERYNRLCSEQFISIHAPHARSDPFRIRPR